MSVDMQIFWNKRQNFSEKFYKNLVQNQSIFKRCTTKSWKCNTKHTKCMKHDKNSKSFGTKLWLWRTLEKFLKINAKDVNHDFLNKHKNESMHYLDFYEKNALKLFQKHDKNSKSFCTKRIKHCKKSNAHHAKIK